MSVPPLTPRATALALLLAACGAPPAADVPAAPAPASVAAPRPAPPKRAVRVLYRGPIPREAGGHVFTSLLGVDRARKVAFLARHLSSAAPYFEVAEVDLAEGGPWAAPRRWIATRENAADARGRSFHPLTGDLATDLARYAGVVERTGPFFTRSRDAMIGPMLSVSARHVAFEHGPDQLWLADRETGARRRLAPALDAAYYPALSPDGRTLAFTGCKYGAPAPGRYQRCHYHLWVQDVAAKAPTRAAAYDPSHPLWSLDGQWIYVAEHDRGYLAEPKDRGGCLVRVRGAAPHDASKVRCDAEQQDLDVTLDPRGETAAMVGHVGAPSERRSRLVWLELPSGAVKRTVELERAGFRASLGPRGLVVVGGATFGDLATGAFRRLDGAKPTMASKHAQVSELWTDEGEVWILRSALDGSEEELLLADVARVLASGASSLDELAR